MGFLDGQQAPEEYLRSLDPAVRSCTLAAVRASLQRGV